jgi:hypothetical protein
MTKSELITEVQGKAWYGGILSTPEIIQEWPSQNVKLYRAHVKVIREANVLSNAHIHFYVFDEGGAGEAANYKDQNPDDQIAVV